KVIGKVDDVFKFVGNVSGRLQFKLICKAEAVAHWLCCTVQDQSVMQEDCIANVSFRSPCHQPMQQYWANHMKKMLITDYSHNLPTNQFDTRAVDASDTGKGCLQ
ncbi:MAG: hypothetical protein ACKPKO_00955, partial [Candidatus Fonsibacter sp.]